MRRLVILMAAGLSLFAAGCGSLSGTDGARVRILNGFVPATGVDSSLSVTSSSGALATAVPEGQFANSSAYSIVAAGTFTASATGAGASTAIQFTTAPTLSNNASYTMVIAGQAGQTGTFAPQLILSPNFTSANVALQTGQAAIRVINVSENPNSVSLFTTTGGTPTAALNASLSGVSFGYTAAANPYVGIMTTQLANLALVDSTATTTALTLSSASNLNTVTFQPGLAYTLYVFGQPGNSTQPLTALWALDYPAT